MKRGASHRALEEMEALARGLRRQRLEPFLRTEAPAEKKAPPAEQKSTGPSDEQMAALKEMYAQKE